MKKIKLNFVVTGIDTFSCRNAVLCFVFPKQVEVNNEMSFPVFCRGAVLCVTMSSTGEQCFSGGVDGTIQSWNTPNPNIDPYDSYGTPPRCLSYTSDY